jgi:hypothetical protein
MLGGRSSRDRWGWLDDLAVFHDEDFVDCAHDPEVVDWGRASLILKEEKPAELPLQTPAKLV